VAQGQMIWDHGIGYGPGRDAGLSFTLKRPQRVYAIRLRYFYDNPPETLEAFQLTWKPGDPDGGADAVRNVRLTLRTAEGEKAEPKTLTVWLNDTLDQLRIYPDDKPFVFHVAEVVLLVPAVDPSEPEA